MFLAFLSTTLLALGLISTATGFSDGFLVVAAVVLALDLFIGLATLGRISGASGEDIRYLQGMNRIRHAYLEMVPGQEDYFITSGYDDVGSVTSLYGPNIARRNAGGILHGLTTTPGMVGAICAAVAGALAAVLTILATHEPLFGGFAALPVFLIVFVAIAGRARRKVRAYTTLLDARFPRSPSAAPGRGMSDSAN